MCLVDSIDPGILRARARPTGEIGRTHVQLDSPSISTSSWLSVFSRSSWPPNPPRELLFRPTASISSMKIMQGAFFLAWLKRSRTRAGPTPTNISRNSEPEMERNGTPASPAVALANSVLPVPGGPDKIAPCNHITLHNIQLHTSCRGGG